LNAETTDLRSMLRRLDPATIPVDQRAALADDLLEFALRLRKEATGLPQPAQPQATGLPSRRKTTRATDSAKSA
jgi:hypothetical protein